MSGGFADVWLGRYEGRPVALKVLRIYGRDNLKKVKKVRLAETAFDTVAHISQSFCREAVLWKRLSHPNILPFLGASTKLFPLCMVCEWMENENIVSYLRKHPRSNRLELVSASCASDGNSSEICSHSS